MPNIEKLLEVAKEAAFAAGEIHMDYFGRAKEISYKQNNYDLVTNADKESENRIFSIINSHFPQHGFLGEETGIHPVKHSEYMWVVDPIDGTTNYSHNFPHFAVSIGLMYQNRILLGVVYDAFKNELFWSAEGNGAYLNSERIFVSQAEQLNESLLSTGFPYDRGEILVQGLKYFNGLIGEAQAIRRPGAASLDLCYVACGRFDGFWELNLSPWDVTAGVCLIREAGGIVTGINGGEFDIHGKNILATNGQIHGKMIKALAACEK